MNPLAKASYAADVGGLLFAPGCTIKVPAITACVPATKTNVEPPPPGGARAVRRTPSSATR